MKKWCVFVCLIFLLVFHGYSQRKKPAYEPWTEAQVDKFMEKTELIPINVTGDKDNRINVVIVNQWTSRDEEPYNSPEMRGEFVKDIEESLVAALTYGDERAQTAYAHYKEFFNVYGLWAPHMPEFKKGIGIPEIDTMRDKLFLPWKDEHKGWVTFLIMPNRDSGGGGAARNLEARYGTAAIAGNGIGKMLHEISHTCMSLGDEYTTHATGTSAFPTYAAEWEYEREKIKWRKWIDPDTPLPTPYEAKYIDKVGAFEGNQYHLVDYYRSTAQGCIMGAGVFDNTEKMCPICNQRVSMRAYDLVDPIKSFSPANSAIKINGKEKIHFSVDHIKPEPNTQIVRWFLNGKLIATGPDELDVEFGVISKYELVCQITDETPNIKPDPPFAVFPQIDVKWDIVNTSPTSSKEITLKLTAKQVDKKTGTQNIKPIIKGGVAPYVYKWSTGSIAESLENAGIGVYDLTVVDSDFRTATAHYAIYESKLGQSKFANEFLENVNITSKIKVDADAKASEIGKENGSIVLNVTGAVAPYKVYWKNGAYDYGDLRVYEPEEADFQFSDYEFKPIFSASDNSYVSFKGNEGSISWDVEVANSGLYPVELIYGGIEMKGSMAQMLVNGQPIQQPMKFTQTRPLYTGWDVSTLKVLLKEGINKITVKSTGQSIPSIDYLRVPTSVKFNTTHQEERINVSVGDYDYAVVDANNNAVQGVVTVPETYAFEVSDIQIESKAPGAVNIVAPLAGYTYKWYAEDAPLTKPEKYVAPIATGTLFKPAHPGNYYVAAQNNLSRAESSNRVGLAIDDVVNSHAFEINPSIIGSEHIKLWLDAADINGDGKVDELYPARGYVKSWVSKTRKMPNEIFMKYESNVQNGKGVATFDKVWLAIMENEIKDYQTIIMVYKESDMSFAGSSLFKGLKSVMGKSKDHTKSIFDLDATDEKTKKGEVFLNGEKIDPFNTPNPMDFCILTVQLDSKSDEGLKRTEGLWEGAVAEMIVIDKKLSDRERLGIEEYLRKKWFSTIDIEFK
jgi:hypothetical protein